MRTERDVLVDCLHRLNASGIEYMLTGSMASNAWGMSRLTHDIDIVVQFTEADVDTIVRAFSDGYFIQEISVRSALRPPYQFNAIDQHSTLKIDFWLRTNEPFAKEMFGRRFTVEFEGTPAWVATAEDVFLHKLYWNKLSPSERQVGDAVGIVAVQQDALDVPYMRHWAKELGVEDMLERILSGKIRPKTT
jgi:hypothetical protein